VLINELSVVPNDFVLSLEDYHVIEKHEIHQMMVFMLEHLPPQMHLVILTRADPPFPLARWRARGELLEIRAKDLRFSLDDATEFLRNMAGLNLPEGTYDYYWTVPKVGYRFAISGPLHSGTGEASELISAFVGGQGYIVDYLIEEVLNHQTETLKSFLLQTSILNRLNGSLCESANGATPWRSYT